VESRVAMCLFTDLAIKRGFRYWVNGYPPPDGDHVLLGFLHSEKLDWRSVLGPEFATQYSDVADVGALCVMCGCRPDAPPRSQ